MDCKVAAERPEFDVEILDLADYPMGFYGDTSTTTAQAETADKWKTRLRTFDAYILTAAEYNHGPTAVLKNAIDYGDWIQKPIGFVGHGGVGGARAVEHLRMIAVEMSAMSVKTGVHILFPDYLAVVKKKIRWMISRIWLKLQKHARPTCMVGQRIEGRSRRLIGSMTSRVMTQYEI